MTEYHVWKWIHIVSSTLLFGTGIGTAFHFLLAAKTRSAVIVFAAARQTVLADWLFTFPTIILQPASGLYLAHIMGFGTSPAWIQWSLVLWLLSLVCWIIVAVLQVRMREISRLCSENNQPLDPAFWRLFRWWATLGVPAFFSFLAIFYLMVVKP